MKVTLLKYTPDAAKLCASAAQTCYSGATYEERTKSGEILTDVGVQKMLDRVISSGHHSTIEHANYTFAIEGVSRALTHQLVRHRIASFSQQSQRYVKLSTPSFVSPLRSEDINEAHDCFNHAMDVAWESYNKLVKMGVKEEDARFVLPNACTTNIVVTMNARELLHFLSLRMCNRAQWEIREVACIMYRQLMEVTPEIFKYAGPNCWNGGCKEQKPCGYPPKKEDSKV